MRKVNRKRLIIFTTILAIISAPVYCGSVMVNPVLFINEAPGAEVFVDGRKLEIDRESYTLYPWKRSYLVEVHAPSGQFKRRIYPWEGSSDSSHIVVREENVMFYVENVVVD
jgi:hypothetical protein